MRSVAVDGGLWLSVFIFGAAGLIIAAGTAASRRRSKGVASWAAAHGWQYAAHDNSYVHLALDYPFGDGYNRSAYDVVTGTAHGYPAACFTYHYDLNRSAQAADNNDRESRYFTVWSLRLGKELPAIRVRQEGILSSLVHPSGMPAVHVGDVRFQRKYKVSADDADFAATLLDTQLRQFLLDSNGNGFEICGSSIFTVQSGQLTEDRVLAELDYLAGVIARFPATAHR